MKAHVYQQLYEGPWSLGLGFNTFVTFLDDSDPRADADRQLTRRGWAKVGDWRLDPKAPSERWHAVVQRASDPTCPGCVAEAADVDRDCYRHDRGCPSYDAFYDATDDELAGMFEEQR